MKSRTLALAALVLVAATAAWAASTPTVALFMSPASGHAYYPAPNDTSKVRATASISGGFNDATTTKRFHFQMTSTTGERLTGSQTTTGTTATWIPDPQPRPGKWQVAVTVGVSNTATRTAITNLRAYVNVYEVRKGK